MREASRRRRPCSATARGSSLGCGGTLRAFVGLELLSEPDEKTSGAADVAEPIRCLVLNHFPDELRSQWRESEVVVHFRVDERGRVDVASMKVLKSDHDLFVAAVREALPRFRFEPARSAAPESKPVADWVDFRVRFAATK